MRIRSLLAMVLSTVSVLVLAQLDVMIGDSYLRVDLDMRWPRESSYLLAGMGGVYRDRKFDMTRGWDHSDGIFTVGLGLSF